MRWLLSDANAEQFPSNGTCCSREVAVRCFSAEANVMSLGRGNRARYSIVVSKQWELVTSVKRRLKTLKKCFFDISSRRSEKIRFLHSVRTVQRKNVF